MQDLPSDVQEYLAAGDGLGVKMVMQRHPDVREKLRSPEVRAALLQYLGGDEPWTSPGPALTALGVILNGANVSEVPVIRPLVMHPEARIRMSAYEVLAAAFNAAKQRESMLTILQSMLMDSDRGVRTHGALVVREMKGQAELRPFLERWVQLAPQRGWASEESFTIVSGLLK